jgi:hypothetical protein
VKLAELSTASQGFNPSLPGFPSFTLHCTGYVPGPNEVVTTVAVAQVAVTTLPDNE